MWSRDYYANHTFAQIAQLQNLGINFLFGQNANLGILAKWFESIATNFHSEFI
jgi:hypothetical protein